MKSKRNYHKEYCDYYGSSYETAGKTQRLHRRHKNSRNQARDIMMKKLNKTRTELGGFDVDHKNKNPLDNSLKNLRLMPIKRNRGICATGKCS